MNILGDTNSEIDPDIQKVIRTETEKLRFKALAFKLTNTCWDACMGTPSARFEQKTQNCFVNCVERFIDTNVYLVTRFDKNFRDDIE